MKLSSKTVLRGALLVAALTLSALATSRPALAACTNGATQWVYNGCCLNATRWKGQSCIFGVWTDNGASKCSGLCME
jgi:hypothetical protein